MSTSKAQTNHEPPKVAAIRSVSSGRIAQAEQDEQPGTDDDA